MNIELREGEKIIKEGKANHFQSIEAVGGKLFATNQRLIFKSHAVNIQDHMWFISYDDIEYIEKRNTLLVVPNGFSIYTKDNKNEKFVVKDRKGWLELIKERINS